MNTYLNVIGGKSVDVKKGEIREHFNPAKPSESIGFTVFATPEETAEAIQQAKKAFSLWKEVSPVGRGEILRKAADILEAECDDIAKTATKEMGKRLVEMKGEVLRGAAILRYYSQEGTRKIGEVLPSANNNNTLLTMRVPVGVVLSYLHGTSQ